MHRRSFLIHALIATTVMAVGVAWGAPTPASTETSPAKPDKRVLIVSVDGLRPDLMLRAQAPTMHKLYKSGSFSFWARTTPMGNTLPSHTSMLTGRTIEHHGVLWNDDSGPKNNDGKLPRGQTLFELAKAGGYSTSMVAGKAKFSPLARGQSVDYLWVPDKTVDDVVVAEQAAKIIREHEPQVMFVHFARVDSTGHGKGWGSHEQIEAVEKADAALARVFDALRKKELFDKTVIILSSDHGGFGKSHHGLDPRGLHIPWIIAGPGIRPDYDLTQHAELVIQTEDTFATACDYLQLDLPEGVDGKPVRQPFEQAPAAAVGQ